MFYIDCIEGSQRIIHGRRNRARLCARHRSCDFHIHARAEVFDKFELGASLWAVWVPLALLHCLPFIGDYTESFLPALRRLRLDQPAADNHAGSPNTSATVHSRDATPFLVVPEDAKDVEHILLRLG